MVESGSLWDGINVFPFVILIRLNIINRRDIRGINFHFVSLFYVYVQSGSVISGVQSSIGLLSYDIKVLKNPS